MPETKTVSKFQKIVYEKCKQIPKGKVSTYGAIAKHIQGNPRAVGGALKRNPFGK
jgi:methylated-DNA-[protein]-cysteine S-methyltransferase